MGWSKAWLPKKPGAQAKPKQPGQLRQRRGVPNKEEAAFGVVLSTWPGVKKIVFEGVTFRIANGARYTPDYFVECTDGTARCYEVKGFRRKAAILALKVAAAQYDVFQFFIAEFDRKTGWTIERVYP